jgi:hypothetical protein
MKVFPKLLFFGGLLMLIGVPVLMQLQESGVGPIHFPRRPNPEPSFAASPEPSAEPTPPAPNLNETEHQNVGSPSRLGLDPRLTMQIAVSLVLLVATLFVILAQRFAPKDKHWAYTTLGTVIGFWLKP